MTIRAEMQAIHAESTTRPPRLRRRTIELDDGHRVGVSLCGEGVPLVMIHGVIAEGMLYAQSLRRIAGMGFKVIAIDSAGHGRSDGLGRDGWRWDSYIDLHLRTLDHLGIERALFVGHSMGGRIVTDLASRQPDRAIGVVPINAAIGRGWDMMTRYSRFAPPLYTLGVSLLVLDTVISGVRGRREMRNLARLAAPSVRGRIRSLPSLPGAVWATGYDQGSDEMLRILAKNQVPVAILHGDRDLTIWYPWARHAAEAADATLVRIEGGGHSWLLENPDSLPAILASLLDGPLAEPFDEAGASIAACYGPEAIALTLDGPRDKPYQLEPGHDWRIDAI